MIPTMLSLPHVISLSRQYGVLLTIYLSAYRAAVHDALVDQQEEAPVSIPGHLLVVVEVRRELGDLAVQRPQLVQMIQDRQQSGLDPDPVLVLMERKVLRIGAAQLPQRAPLQRLKVLERSVEVIVERHLSDPRGVVRTTATTAR